MAQPGWYPDPAGSGAPRYWDGERWEPVAPGGRAAGDGRGAGRLALIAVALGLLAILLVVGALIWQPWNSSTGRATGDTNSSRPTGSQWNELEPTATPSSPQPTDGDGRPVACPFINEAEGTRQGNLYVSGDMAFRGVPGWSEEGGGWTIDFASNRSGQADPVTPRWISVTAIGQLSTTDFSPDPRTAATQVSDCLSSSYFYATLDFRERLQDEPFATSGGVRGWIIRENYWNVPGEDVSGDEVVVVVLEAGGEDTLTLFHSQAPIGDQERQDLVGAALDSLSRR